MKRGLWCASLLFALVAFWIPTGQAQNTYTQQFTVTVVPAPPAILNSQTFSNSTNTGVLVSTTGGSIAAGTYRICVTFMTNAATTTESNCSVDTASTSVVTTTGTTSSITVYPPNTTGAGANVAGWRVWIGTTGGSAGNEGATTATATICPLSTTVTASCSLNSPAVLTASPASGTAPATYTAFVPAVAQQATTAIYENSLATSHTLYWTVAGTAPTACTVRIYDGTLPSSLSAVGTLQTCTATGSYTVEGISAAYFGINMVSLTPGDATTVVTFYYTGTQNLQVGQLQDGSYWVPLQSCGWSSTTAIGTATTGTGDPGIKNVSAGQQVLYVNVASSNADVVTLDCDISPPSRLTTGKAVNIQSVDVYYGMIYATVTLTAGTPTMSTNTFPAAGASAGDTVAAAGGTLTANPATIQKATTTSGNCYHLNLTPAAASPVNLSSALVRLNLEEAFTASGSAAVQEYQLCGVNVNYSLNPI